MVTYTISLSEKQSQQLREIANQYNIAPEELVRASVEDLLNRPQSDFQEALEYGLKKMPSYISDWHNALSHYCRCARNISPYN